jgi:alkyl hydroperoxide reductase subunit AhpC
MNYDSTLDVGDEIPAFDLESQLGRIFFKDIVEAKWCLVVTFSSAFDPVGTTDFGLISKLFEEFESRNILILAIGNETGRI